MTIQEQHIALCEWVGWKKFTASSWHDPNGVLQFELPPFTLDWLHEVVGKLTDYEYEGEDGFTANLARVTQGNKTPLTGWKFRPMQEATKEERLEALCRTLFPERFKCHVNTCQP